MAALQLNRARDGEEKWWETDKLWRFLSASGGKAWAKVRLVQLVPCVLHVLTVTELDQYRHLNYMNTNFQARKINDYSFFQ